MGAAPSECRQGIVAAVLEEITLWNVGGIRHCTIPFQPGLTVITGESGAGKSSIVRAIELVSGKRAQSAIIRGGEEEAGAEAIFSTDLTFPELDECARPVEKNLFAKRAISRSGRGRASLQGCSVPLGLFSQAVSRLLHIQSQFAQMELLDTERQLEMVDSCGGPELLKSLAELRSAFEQARLHERELRELTERRTEIERRYANAGEVVPLVQKVKPEPGLEASLELSIGELRHQTALKAKARQNLDRLTGGLSEQGFLDELKSIAESLVSALPDDDRKENERMLHDGLQLIKDVAENAQRELGGQAEETQELDRLEARLGALRRLKRLASANTEEDLLAYCQGAVEGMSWLEQSYNILEEASQKARELRRQASQLALAIRKGRKEAAVFLEKGVNNLLNSLGMEGIAFSIQFNELPKLRRSGADEVEFLLSTEKRSGRVDKIASGGELSRLLLALQLALPDEWLPPTLVFDEVEAGLGGRAAVLSGLKLKELSRRCQVVLVTHEASIAALGNVHIVVRREGGESEVGVVEGADRRREIARMLSGTPDLEEALEHAQKLLDNSE